MELTNKELSKMRAALTRAKNSKSPQKLLEVAKAGMARFEEAGYPDCWHTWQRAEEDARIAIACGRKTL